MSPTEREFLVNLGTLLFLLSLPVIAVLGAALLDHWRTRDR